MVASGTAINSVWQVVPNMSIRSSTAYTSRKTRVAGQNLQTNLGKHGSSGRSSKLSALLLGTTRCGPKGGHNHRCAAKRCSGRLRHKRALQQYRRMLDMVNHRSRKTCCQKDCLLQEQEQSPGFLTQCAQSPARPRAAC